MAALYVEVGGGEEGGSWEWNLQWALIQPARSNTPTTTTTPSPLFLFHTDAATHCSAPTDENQILGWPQTSHPLLTVPISEGQIQPKPGLSQEEMGLGNWRLCLSLPSRTEAQDSGRLLRGPAFFLSWASSSSHLRLLHFTVVSMFYCVMCLAVTEYCKSQLYFPFLGSQLMSMFQYSSSFQQRPPQMMIHSLWRMCVFPILREHSLSHIPKQLSGRSWQKCGGKFIHTCAWILLMGRRECKIWEHDKISLVTKKQIKKSVL